MLLSLEVPTFPKTILTMMTQDRSAIGIATHSPRNMNPATSTFHQGHAAPFSPQNLNPSAPVFHHSPTGERSSSEGIYSRADAGQQVILTNGDITGNSTNFLMSVTGGMLREASPQSQLAHQIQSLQSSLPIGLALAPHTIGAGSASNHQPGIPAVTSQQQVAYAMALQDTATNQRVLQKHSRTSNPNSPYIGNGETYESQSTVSLGGDEETTKETGRAEELDVAGSGQEYPEEVLAPIIKQMQFYFSNENLPNDKFLNQHMDVDKYIPLELFLDFGRIKPICNSVDQLTKAVESSSILELSEDRKKVRVSQCRKTLTLRGFPQSATEDDVRQFILEMGAYVPTHIEFVMFKEKYSVWYVSFKDETAALNSFFQFHNNRPVYKDHTIGCCIKSSGTLAAAGYFPSMEESNQRRMAYQSQVAATAVPAPVHTVQNPIPQPQPQQPQALIQQFSAMQLHSYLPGSAANIYYQQTPQGSYLPYVTGMLHSWPGPASPLEPGLIMQNSGLQPQHIRASIPRAHMLPPGNAGQHRFNRAQRTRQNNLESNNIERPGDRPSLVSVSGPSQSSPLISDSTTTTTVISQGAYLPRRTTVQDDIPPPIMSQPQVVAHQFVTPLVQQQHQQQQHATTTATVSTAVVNQSSIESVAVPQYQPLSHHHHHPPQHHQHTVIVQPDTATVPPPSTQQMTSNPPPSTQQMHLHHHHHSQPPPLIPQHHHQQQPHQQHQTGPSVQHSNQTHHPFNQQPMPPLLQTHHQQQPPASHNQHHHSNQHQQHQMMSPYHHHHSQQQQQHHQYIPPKIHHQQFPSGNRGDKRNRRKKEENAKNNRGERGQSSRGNLNSQAIAAADNFTMEANSFPPLPGALNSISNCEVSHENRMSDIVRGISRNPSLSNSSGPKAPSTTPSPVATPAPTSVILGNAAGQHGHSGSILMDDSGVDNGDSALDDDDVTSSPEEADTENSIFEPRSVRPDLQPMSSALELPVFPSQFRANKIGTPIVTIPATVMTTRQNDSRQGTVAMQTESKGAQSSANILHHQRQSSPTAEAPKLSYAQILAQKNREASSSACNGDNSSAVMVTNPSSGTSNENSVVLDNTLLLGGNRTSNQSTNAFREHGNYQGGQAHGPRSFQRGSSKDGNARSDGPPSSSSRQPNGNRRNSKENRTWNKFERRKPDTRQN